MGVLAGQASAQTTTTYTYDALGRLTQAVTGSTTSTYAYDAADNRTSFVRTVPGGAEITSITFTATSAFMAYTGLTTPGGMRDGDFSAMNSIHGTQNGANQSIQADLGVAQTVGHIEVASALTSAPGGWGPAYINGAVVEYSTTGSSWTTVATVAGVADGAYTAISLGGVTARYIRLRMASNYLGMGDFRVYA